MELAGWYLVILQALLAIMNRDSSDSTVAVYEMGGRDSILGKDRESSVIILYATVSGAGTAHWAG